MNNTKILIIGLVVTVGIAGFLFWPGNSPQQILSDKTQIVMHKNPGCQCCTKWAEHMMEGEFHVEENPTPEIGRVKMENGITRELASCHTAIVGDYVVEGHVPIKEVRRLLDEKPDAIGLTVPGMPTGSPGMEVAGRPADKYDVLLINKDGSTSVYASY
ncbi:MAG: DUF411 domain-containing protein [Balneolaceae bacterium]|nr:DUF411 domain-containing protein [Balneolaceae bacterium]